MFFDVPFFIFIFPNYINNHIIIPLPSLWNFFIPGMLMCSYRNAASRREDSIGEEFEDLADLRQIDFPSIFLDKITGFCSFLPWAISLISFLLQYQLFFLCIQFYQFSSLQYKFSTWNYQLSSLNYQLSSLNYQFSSLSFLPYYWVLSVFFFMYSFKSWDNI